MVALVKPDNQIAQPQGKSNEWYTPARYIEAARLVMGDIDLDPASCELANQTVKATRYYSKKDDGFSKEWYGRIWLNPPYAKDIHGQSNLEKWVLYLLQQYEQGNVREAILLVPLTQATAWFDMLWDYLICFPPRRIHFYSNDRNDWRPRFSSCFVYLGTNEQKFVDTFSQFGTIAKRVSPPKSAPSTLWEVTL